MNDFLGENDNVIANSEINNIVIINKCVRETNVNHYTINYLDFLQYFVHK